MKKIILISLILSLLIISSPNYSFDLRKRNSIDFGVRPFYGIVFGEFGDKYNNPFGFLLYGSGLYELNIYTGLNLYPEVCLGWFYMSHSSESDRSLNFFPLYVNCMLDWDRLRIDSRWGRFSFIPFLGLSSYFTSYKSGRESVTGFDWGYQFGLNTVYKHEKFRDFFIEFGIKHFLATEIEATLSGLTFSLGAGYTFSTAGISEDDRNLKKEYLTDLNTNDENKIITAAHWLGRERVNESVPRFVELLLKDERASIRTASAVALGLIRDKNTLDSLTLAATKDTNPDVRYSALLAISRITPTSAIMKQISEMKNTEKDSHIIDYINTMEQIFK